MVEDRREGCMGSELPTIVEYEVRAALLETGTSVHFISGIVDLFVSEDSLCERSSSQSTDHHRRLGYNGDSCSMTEIPRHEETLKMKAP